MSPALISKPLSSLSTKFGCIVADPPWLESGGGKIKRGADRHYPLMKTEEIAALQVQSIVPANAHLYMWITNNFLARGAHVQVANAWGFRPVTVLTWKKLGRIGLGQYFRGTTEHVVFCVRGAPPYKIRADGIRAQGVTDFNDVNLFAGLPEGAWFEEPRPGAHSRKPTKIHEWAELVSHGPYLEMFARTARPGWEAWGNEAPEALDVDVLR
jgi:N6-adenosine-specific RNA methylase IME4